MRVEHDTSHDQAYIYLREIEAGGVAETASAASGINLDFDHEGRLVGIEIAGEASSRLPLTVLAGATRLGPPEKLGSVRGPRRLRD